MLERTIDHKFRYANSVLHKRIALLETALLEKENARVALLESEIRYRRLFESAKDGILILDEGTGKVADVNPFLLHLLGYSYDELCGQYIWELGVFKDIAASKEAFRILQDNEYIRYDDLPLESRDGHPISVEFVSNVYLVDHIKVIQCNIRDITGRKRADAERKRLMAAIEQTGDAIIMTDEKGTIQFVNAAFKRTTGYTSEEVLGLNARMLKSGQQDEIFYHTLWETISSGKTWAGRIINKHKDGTFYTEETSISPVRDSKGNIVNYVAVKRDITEELRLAVQFQQAQKMEAVGQLAGGVAHDYNNMLSVILGYTELALKNVDSALPLYTDLMHIYKAAKRSTGITRQLLAFARKQPIAPVALDLNKNMGGTLSILRRLIGENIGLDWLPEHGLFMVLMDPIQVDQILTNLCVNARDAIDGVGKITIETGNATFDDAYCSCHSGYIPGKYALLAVSDDGCGMDKATLDQIFEPFFTSKPAGQGTGLGLSTVYGIVKQNKGFINIYSEPGKGTTVKVYLPEYSDIGGAAEQKTEPEIPRGRGETVLLVEDESDLLALGAMMLVELGYRVVTAGSPSEAVRMAEKHAGEIKLLITDVVMPEMNGWDLAELLHTLDSGLKVLFMSGYTANVIAHRGVHEEGVNFIQKPFSLRSLAVTVRETLDEK
jgi:two-component system, cell cycle sensor histidine kinase and response regulator CckA